MKGGTTTLAEIADRYGKDLAVLAGQIDTRTDGEPVTQVTAVSQGANADAYEVLYGKGQVLEVFVNPTSGQAIVREKIEQAMAA